MNFVNKDDLFIYLFINIAFIDIDIDRYIDI